MSSPRVVSRRLSPPPDPGQQHVVDRAAQRLADDLHVGQRDAHDREHAVPARVRVDRRARRDRVAVDHRAERAAQLARTLQRLARAAQQRAERAEELGRFGRALAQRVDEQLRRARRRLGRPFLDDGCDVVGARVEEQRRDVDTRHTVDERVMRLLDERDVAVFEALDEPELPQRAFAVEELFLHACGERDQLLPRAGLRQRGVAHVVRHVETRVVDPDRAALVVGHVHQPAPEAREQREARAHEIAHFRDPEAAVLVEERRAFEHADRTDVHRVLEPLQVQEAGVEAGKPVVAGHRPMLGVAARDTVYRHAAVRRDHRVDDLARARARARRAARPPRRQLPQRLADVVGGRRSGHPRMAAASGRRVPRAGRRVDVRPLGVDRRAALGHRRSARAAPRRRGAAAHRDVGRPRVLRGVRRRTPSSRSSSRPRRRRSSGAPPTGSASSTTTRSATRGRRPNGAVSIVALLLAQLEARETGSSDS